MGTWEFDEIAQWTNIGSEGESVLWKEKKKEGPKESRASKGEEGKIYEGMLTL